MRSLPKGLLVWICLACVPILLIVVARWYALSIGCPRSGDCYVPGSEDLIYYDGLAFLSVLVIWPVCVLRLMWALWRRFVRPLTLRPRRTP